MADSATRHRDFLKKYFMANLSLVNPDPSRAETVDYTGKSDSTFFWLIYNKSLHLAYASNNGADQTVLWCLCRYPPG